jgi:hypothetical protein
MAGKPRKRRIKPWEKTRPDLFVSSRRLRQGQVSREQVAAAVAAFQRAGGLIERLPTVPGPPRTMVPCDGYEVDAIGRLI